MLIHRRGLSVREVSSVQGSRTDAFHGGFGELSQTNHIVFWLHLRIFHFSKQNIWLHLTTLCFCLFFFFFGRVSGAKKIASLAFFFDISNYFSIHLQFNNLLINFLKIVDFAFLLVTCSHRVLNHKFHFYYSHFTSTFTLILHRLSLHSHVKCMLIKLRKIYKFFKNCSPRQYKKDIILSVAAAHPFLW